MIVNFLIMPIFFLSGALFPLDNLPTWLFFLTRLDPLTYGVDLLRGIIIGIGAFPALLNIGLVALFAVSMLAVAVIEFNLSD